MTPGLKPALSAREQREAVAAQLAFQEGFVDPLMDRVIDRQDRAERHAHQFVTVPTTKEDFLGSGEVNFDINEIGRVQDRGKLSYLDQAISLGAGNLVVEILGTFDQSFAAEVIDTYKTLASANRENIASLILWTANKMGPAVAMELMDQAFPSTYPTAREVYLVPRYKDLGEFEYQGLRIDLLRDILRMCPAEADLVLGRASSELESIDFSCAPSIQVSMPSLSAEQYKQLPSGLDQQIAKSRFYWVLNKTVGDLRLDSDLAGGIRNSWSRLGEEIRASVGSLLTFDLPRWVSA